MTPTFSAQSRLSDFFTGLALPFRALRLIFGSKKLFLLSTIASLVTLVALVTLVTLLGAYTDDFLRRFVFEPETWYGKAGFFILTVLTFLLFLVIGANTVPVLLLAPLQDPISEATEEVCGGFVSPKFTMGAFVNGTMVALGHTALRIVFLIGGHAVLFALNLIPGVGSVLWTVGSILWTVAWLATEYLDAPMARHLYRFSDVRKAVTRRLPLCMGLGAAIYLLLWIPVLNLFFIPLAIVAGTLLFRGLRASGDLPPPAQLAGGVR